MFEYSIWVTNGFRSMFVEIAGNGWTVSISTYFDVSYCCFVCPWSVLLVCARALWWMYAMRVYSRTETTSNVLYCDVTSRTNAMRDTSKMYTTAFTVLFVHYKYWLLSDGNGLNVSIESYSMIHTQDEYILTPRESDTDPFPYILQNGNNFGWRRWIREHSNLL